MICAFIASVSGVFGIVPVCRALTAHGISISPRTWRSSCRSTPPVAAMIVSFMVSSFFSRLIGPGQFQVRPSGEPAVAIARMTGT